MLHKAYLDEEIAIGGVAVPAEKTDLKLIWNENYDTLFALPQRRPEVQTEPVGVLGIQSNSCYRDLRCGRIVRKILCRKSDLTGPSYSDPRSVHNRLLPVPHAKRK